MPPQTRGRSRPSDPVASFVPPVEPPQIVGERQPRLFDAPRVEGALLFLVLRVAGSIRRLEPTAQNLAARLPRSAMSTRNVQENDSEPHAQRRAGIRFEHRLQRRKTMASIIGSLPSRFGRPAG